MNKEKIKQIQQEFINEYVTPGNKYFSGVGISGLRVHMKEAELRENESLDDLCLYVNLKEKPPKEFPSEYKGARVFYTCVGEIRAC